MARLLDLCCGAGLVSDGYAEADCEVVGVDIVEQPDYPHLGFIGDALRVLNVGVRPAFLLSDFDAIHASFPPDPVTGKPRPWGVYHVPGDSIPKGGRTARDLDHGKQVMGVPADRKITWHGLKEGLPPAYTRWIGEQLAAHLEGL